MQRVTIALPDALYAELQEAATAIDEFGYGPANWAGDLIASELAARRLPKVGLRIRTEAEPHRPKGKTA